ncbi:MAG: hypothetical protein ACERLM_13280, partial [Acidimicrobiales bacterium]
MTVIEVFADVGCPFAHMGLSMLVAERGQRDRSDVTLRVRAWPLEIVNGTGFDARVVADKAEALRSQLGTDRFHDFDGSAYASTFLPAMELTTVAYETDPTTGEAVALEVRELTFEQGIDVADPAVLVDLARRHGPCRIEPAQQPRTLVSEQDPLARRRAGDGLVGVAQIGTHQLFVRELQELDAAGVARDQAGHERPF